MLFNSLPFLVFFPAFLALYFATRGRTRLWVCLVSSYLFYGWWDWRFLGLLGTSTVLDFAIGLKLSSSTDPRVRRTVMQVSVVANLGFLGFFKYFNFFVDSFAKVSLAIGIHVHPSVLHVILPVGISFYTFQSLSYTLDVYWNHIDVERDFVRYATFVSFWPQLVAGPIVRAGHLLPQFRKDHAFDPDALIAGLHLMLWGFFKKVVIADSLATVVDARFTAPDSHGTLSLFVGVFFYAFQIYCDFSGYSDIAIGAARILGFDFGFNFRTPYFSRSFSEFWTRWHVSLSSWLRDYLYIPLGGNRGRALATYRNLMIVMLLGGLWHGANWTFLVWGGLHGMYLVVQRLAGRWSARVADAWLVPSSIRSGIAMAAVFGLTCFAWIFFRAPTLTAALHIVGRTFGLSAIGDTGVPMSFEVVKGVFLIALLVGLEAMGAQVPVRRTLDRSPWIRLATASALLWCIALLGTFSGARFIYFQF